MAAAQEGALTKQREIAKGCSMTVLTEPEPFIYNDNAIATALARTYPELVPPDGEDFRYDLLSLPGLKYLPKNRELLDQTVHDMLIALELHQAEHLLVVTADHTHTPVVQRLKDDPRLRKRLRLIRGYTAKARRVAVPLRTLAVPCMDWRKHDGGGFLAQFDKVFKGGESLGVMTVPGVGKEIKEGTQRGRLLIGLLHPLVRRGLQRIVLVGHTDCGKYGGTKAFADEGAERAQLAADLAEASDFIRRSYDIRVERGIAVIAGDRVSSIQALT